MTAGLRVGYVFGLCLASFAITLGMLGHAHWLPALLVAALGYVGHVESGERLRTL